MRLGGFMTEGRFALSEDPNTNDWPTGLYAFTGRVVPKAPFFAKVAGEAGFIHVSPVIVLHISSRAIGQAVGPGRL